VSINFGPCIKCIKCIQLLWKYRSLSCVLRRTCANTLRYKIYDRLATCVDCGCSQTGCDDSQPGQWLMGEPRSQSLLWHRYVADHTAAAAVATAATDDYFDDDNDSHWRSKAFYSEWSSNEWDVARPHGRWRICTDTIRFGKILTLGIRTFNFALGVCR